LFCGPKGLPPLMTGCSR
jgi:hypothetical protein